MREQVHNNWIRRDEEPSIPKKKSGINQGAGDSENQVRLNYNVNCNMAKRCEFRSGVNRELPAILGQSR